MKSLRCVRFVVLGAMVAFVSCGAQSTRDSIATSQEGRNLEGTVAAAVSPGTAKNHATRTNKYLKLSSRQFETNIHINDYSLWSTAPFGCYGGGVWLWWFEVNSVGALPHDARFDATVTDCDDADIQELRQKAATQDGTAEAAVTVRMDESYQFGSGDDCVRGLYEYVEIRFVGNERVFSNYAYTMVQELSASQCEQLIAISGLNSPQR